MMTNPNFHDLSETIPDHLLPPLNRKDAVPSNANQAYWRDHGYLILPGFMPESLVDAYAERRSKDGEYITGTPYMKIPEIRDLCLWKPLMDVLRDLVGYEMALHLNLCGWVSTERDYHQDDYLNPQFINGHYAAIWFALADINPDSGPFEYIDGSHKWPVLRREKVLAHMPPGSGGNPNWPRLSQGFVSDAMEAYRQEQGLPVRQFIAKKCDVLIWHSFLMHRGSPPKVPGMERRSLIAHYSAIKFRKDMPQVAQHGTAGKYFVL